MSVSVCVCDFTFPFGLTNSNNMVVLGVLPKLRLQVMELGLGIKSDWKGWKKK